MDSPLRRFEPRNTGFVPLLRDSAGRFVVGAALWRLTPRQVLSNFIIISEERELKYFRIWSAALFRRFLFLCFSVRTPKKPQRRKNAALHEGSDKNPTLSPAASPVQRRRDTRRPLIEPSPGACHARASRAHARR